MKLQTGSSSCQCPATLIGQENDMMEFLFRFQNKSRNTRKDSRNDTGLFWVLEMKRSGMKLFLTHLKENGILLPLKWYNDSMKPVVFKSISAMSRGILKETIHFNGGSSNTEILFRINHPVNQLSIYGAVANWREQFGLTKEEKGREKLRSVNKNVWTSVNSQEVQLLVSPLKMASGNCLHEKVLNFEELSDKIQFSKLCEDVWF